MRTMSDLRVGLTERLLPRLRCPRCKHGTLAIVDGPLEVRDATFAQAGEDLRRVACEAAFPLTEAMRAFIVGDDAQVSAVSANLRARNPPDPSYCPCSAFALPIGADRARPAGPSPA